MKNSIKITKEEVEERMLSERRFSFGRAVWRFSVNLDGEFYSTDYNFAYTDLDLRTDQGDRAIGTINCKADFVKAVTDDYNMRQALPYKKDA